MELQVTWLILFFCLSTQVNCNPHVSKQDLSLLASEPYPRCFTRTLVDFTCFWEAPVGKSYDFLYKTDDDAESRCNTNLQKSEEGKILHICSFPSYNVFIFALTHIRVVDKDTNATVYSRTLSVEDNCLFYPPANVTLHRTGKAGQILVKWLSLTELKNPDTSVTENMQHEIRYTSKAHQDIAKLKKGSRCEHILLSLVPGQPYTVQVRNRVSLFDTSGHWSDWSYPVTIMVPQPAADISLKCHTPDLHQVQCQWNEEQYGYANLHYRQTERNIWGNWKTCDKTNASSHCALYGDECTIFQVYLTAMFGLLDRTFYMDAFRMNESIRTEPPGELMEEIIGDRLCLRWSSPLPQISEHLLYEIRYHLEGQNNWKIFTVQTPSTSTCLDVQANGQYTIQVKAMPNGLFFSGHWSDWSKPFTKQVSTFNTGLLFIVCVLFGFIVITLVLFSFFSRYARKLKQVLWPPVPNLNGVLENFLKDINEQHWEPNICIKHCDDTPASVVEIMSEKEAQVMKEPSWPSNCLYFTQYQQAEDRNEKQGLDMSREYVILKSSPVYDLTSMTGNDYVYGLNTSSDHLGERVCGYISLCSDTFSASANNILNHSYLQADIGSLRTITGHYTNLENVATCIEE